MFQEWAVSEVMLTALADTYIKSRRNQPCSGQQPSEQGQHAGVSSALVQQDALPGTGHQLLTVHIKARCLLLPAHKPAAPCRGGLISRALHEHDDEQDHVREHEHKEAVVLAGTQKCCHHEAEYAAAPRPSCAADHGNMSTSTSITACKHKEAVVLAGTHGGCHHEAEHAAAPRPGCAADAGNALSVALSGMPCVRWRFLCSLGP